MNFFAGAMGIFWGIVLTSVSFVAAIGMFKNLIHDWFVSHATTKTAGPHELDIARVWG